MRMLGIVIFYPGRNDIPHLLEVFKQIRVQHIFPESLVESFTIAVLHRFPLLNPDMINGVVRAKLLKSPRDKFRSIVGPDISGFSIPVNKLFEQLYYFFRGKTESNLTH